MLLTRLFNAILIKVVSFATEGLIALCRTKQNEVYLVKRYANVLSGLMERFNKKQSLLVGSNSRLFVLFK